MPLPARATALFRPRELDFCSDVCIFEKRQVSCTFPLYFWGQKYQKPPHVVLRGSVRAAALHGARKIWPMRHPVADAPQLAPSFSASNESADLLCRRWRHFLFYLAMHPGILFPQGGSRLGSDGGKADEGLKARAAGAVCLQTRAVARRRFQTSGRRHRNRSGGFCCFSPPKSREKSFPKFYAESLRGFREVAVPTNFFLLVLLRPKVPKASARRFPRECASRGAARGAQDQAYAPPRGGRAAARTLFFRVKRECGLIVPPTAALIIYIWQCAPAFFLPARRFPTWFRWRKSGRRAESESGGDGLLANPRSRPTPLSAFRTPASESVGWLLLLFATEKQGKKFFGTFLKRGKDFGGFCCFSPLKSREKSFSELNVREIFGKSHPAAGCSQYVPT